jgi:hypothetical protein
MRKQWIAALAALGVLAVAVPVAVAADQQVNTYTVKGGITGAKGASKSKPKPAKLAFGFHTGEQHNYRPATVSKYSIFFSGAQVTNNTAFAGCDIKKINDPAGNGLSDCSKKSIIGKGTIVNEVGPPSDVTDKSLYCFLNLTPVNGTKKGQLLLWLEGGPKASTDPKKNCVQDTHEAINAKWVKKSGGVAIEFNVPTNLLHPAGGALDNGITDVNSSINKVTTKVKGKTVGLVSATTCGPKNVLSVAFTQESDNVTSTAKSVYACK